MRSAADLRNAASRSAASIIVATVPPAILGRLLHAEGPTVLLTVWSAMVVLLTASATALRSLPRFPKRVATVTALLAAASGGVGALVALAQLNVARRSLAEAWIEIARMGEAFGFFSFFATELYALFCLGSSLLFLARRPAAALVAFLSATAFTAGVILGDARALALALATAAAVPILAVRGRRGEKVWSRLRSVVPPAVAALIASLPFACFETLSPAGPLMRPIDLTPLVRALVPAFPLLLDVPGYGYEIDGSHLAPSVYLSDGILFDAEGDGPGLHYIVSAVYSDWSEGFWRETQDAGREIAVERSASTHPRLAGALRLRLAEDFYSLIPVERTTASVSLSRGAPEVEVASRNRGLRFAGSGRRGLVADLEPGEASGEERISEGGADAPGGRWLNAGADPSGRLATLAAELVLSGEKASGGLKEGRDRAVIQSILAHFKEGYTYALKVRDGRDGAFALDRFIFDEKKGYCLHYATACVLLARHAGISARVVEGFRVSLGERGLGSVRGVDAHAWVEAWVDGAWRVFEPTPPFAAADPFAYLDSKDSGARRQLEALFGRTPTVASDRKRFELPVRALLVGAASLAALLVAFILVFWLSGHSRAGADIRAAKRRASRLVALSRALGIAGPEVLGWTGWARSVRLALAGREGSKDESPVRSRNMELDGVEAAAETMLRIAFDVPSRG